MEQQEKALKLKYEENYYIIQANELIRSKQDELTLLEAKLIRLAIAQIIETDTEFKTYTCNVVDLARYLGIDKSNIYKEIDELTTSIMRKVIKIKSKDIDTKKKNPWKKFHWVSRAEYKDGVITIRLADDLTPYLLGLTELFTRYNYSEVVNLPTVYSIRLFELLVSFQNMPFRNYGEKRLAGQALGKNEVGFSIDYLREYFNCEDKYPNTGDFIRFVIEPAIKAIQKKTILKVEYRKIKQGRNINFIVFNLNDYPITPEGEAMRKRVEAFFQRRLEEETGINPNQYSFWGEDSTDY